MIKREFNLPEQIEVKEYIKSIDFPGYYKQNHGFQCWLIDQKVTYDILNLICKCILNKYGNKPNISFHHNDFLDDQYSKNIFYSRTSSNGKAILSNKTTKEYDKLFRRLSKRYSDKELEYKIKEALYKKGLYYED